MANGEDDPVLCTPRACRRIRGHPGNHDPYPTEVWRDLAQKDRDKLTKAGFATPRGGAKGAYQNHVLRNSKVILPFERLGEIDRAVFRDGWVVRLFPHHYFDEATGKPKAVFERDGTHRDLVVGQNAFVLYRSHDQLTRFPRPSGWTVRTLMRGDEEVEERGKGVQDRGEYVIRVPQLGQKAVSREGKPQGIFAPEYADEETNYLCRCVLAWLTVNTVSSTYVTRAFGHLRAVLNEAKLFDVEALERRGAMRRSFTACPLCTRLIRYNELHDQVSFEGEAGLENATEQVAGTVRSTIVNLFHIEPLNFRSLQHRPEAVAWGHATCNTRLGQRRCHSLAELQETDRKVALVVGDTVETFGWISGDWQMIRSPLGAVWVQLSGDRSETDRKWEEDLHAAPGGVTPTTSKPAP